MLDPSEPRCTHPDRGATVAVKCPKCRTLVTLPADPVDHATDRFCPVCNGQLPYLPARSEADYAADAALDNYESWRDDPDNPANGPPPEVIDRMPDTDLF